MISNPHFTNRFLFDIKVSLLFEVEDLSVASPATVSRCGMVYTDYADIGWQPYVTSWISKRKDKVGYKLVTSVTKYGL